MSGPQTEAGRALLERETPPPSDHLDPSEVWVADMWELRNEMEGRILAIEREAVAAALAAHDCFWDGQPDRPKREPQDIASLRLDVTDEEADAFLAAIENGADPVAAFLASPEAAEGLALALDDWLQERGGVEPEDAAAILAAWQQGIDKKPAV